MCVDYLCVFVSYAYSSVNFFNCVCFSVGRIFFIFFLLFVSVVVDVVVFVGY